MENPKEDDAAVTVTDLLGEDTMTLYGFCPSCQECHTDLDRIIDYFQMLSDRYMINFN